MEAITYYTCTMKLMEENNSHKSEYIITYTSNSISQTNSTRDNTPEIDDQHYEENELSSLGPCYNYSIDKSTLSTDLDEILQEHQHNSNVKSLNFDDYNTTRLFTSTVLICSETYSQNENQLILSLIQYGKFTYNSIEEINFKNDLTGNYAIIRVRAPLQIIMANMKKLNNNRGKNVLTLFKKKHYNSKISSKPQRVLYVNHFDILNAETHHNFTDLFLKFGSLLEDIKIESDEHKDPYGIVVFRKLKDAKKCHDNGNIVFEGRKLSIEYSEYHF